MKEKKGNMQGIKRKRIGLNNCAHLKKIPE